MTMASLSVLPSGRSSTAAIRHGQKVTNADCLVWNPTPDPGDSVTWDGLAPSPVRALTTTAVDAMPPAGCGHTHLSSGDLRSKEHGDGSESDRCGVPGSSYDD